VVDTARTSQRLNLRLTVVALDELKGKAIQEYDKLLRELKKGKRPKYDFLMTLISYIGLPARLDNSDFVEQQLINHDDTIYIRRR
jgi:hypothetical protein